MRYEDILNSLTTLIYAKTKKEIECNNINNLELGSYFIEVIDYKKNFNSQHRDQLSISFDIYYLPINEDRVEIFNALDDLDNMFEIEGKRILKVKDRYLTIKNVDMKEIDFIGHYLFDLEFYVDYGKPYGYKLMKDLDFKLKLK